MPHRLARGAVGSTFAAIEETTLTLTRMTMAALLQAEQALDEGDENCGREEDSAFHEPLKTVRTAIVRGIAYEFAKDLHELLGFKMNTVCRRNREEPQGSSVCHTHDYCDANMVMDEALRDLGIDPFDAEDGQQISEEMQARWNAAWDMAKRCEFDGARILVAELPAEVPA